MANKKKNYNKDKTRYILIESLHMVHVMNYKMFSFYKSIYGRKIQKMMTDLIKEGKIEKYKIGTNKSVYCLKDYEKYIDEYRENMKEGYVEDFLEFGKKDIYFIKIKSPDKKNNKTNESRIRKIISDSEILIFMHIINLKSYINEKPYLAQLSPENNKGMFYYSGKEIKRFLDYKDEVEIKDNIKKIGTTRLNGIILAPSNNYMIYNFQDKIKLWHVTGEYKIKQEISKKIIPNYNNKDIQNGIIFGYNLNTFSDLITQENKIPGINYEIIDRLFKHLYIFTYDNIATEHIKIILSPTRTKKIKEIIFGEIHLPYNKESPFCDNYNPQELTYDLAFCIPDIIKLRKFIIQARLEGNRNKYTIYCFDYQKEFLKQIAEEYVIIKSAPFEMMLEKIKEKEGNKNANTNTK